MNTQITPSRNVHSFSTPAKVREAYEQGHALRLGGWIVECEQVPGSVFHKVRILISVGRSRYQCIAESLRLI